MDDLSRMFDRLNADDPDSYIFTFVHPTKSRKITYRQQQELLRIALEEEEEFKDGFVMDTVEKGVLHPVIHVKRVPCDLKVCTSTAFLKIKNDRIVNIDSSKEMEEKFQDDLINSRVQLLEENALGPDVSLQQGIFRELKRIEPDYLHTRRDRVEHRAFLVVGMPRVDPRMTSTIEAWWRDWTGARSIYLKLRTEHDLGRIIFYRRTSSCKDSSLFGYLVVAECWNVTPKNELAMFDFVQRIRIEHINAYISLYRDLDVTPTSISGRSLVWKAIPERILSRRILCLDSSGDIIRPENVTREKVEEVKKNGRGFQANVEWRKELEVRLKDHEATR